MQTYYKAGTWNVICQVCGRKYKSDQIRKRWDGLLVCDEDYENRHILDFLRAHPEMGSVPYASQENTDEFIFVCYLEQSQGIADTGTADCARADIVLTHLPEK